jgi:hypothetical protein
MRVDFPDPEGAVMIMIFCKLDNFEGSKIQFLKWIEMITLKKALFRMP